MSIDRRVFIRGGSTLALSALAVRTPAIDEGARALRSSCDQNTTAEEITAGIDLTGKTALITGCNSGLGHETLRVLVLRGAHVFALARTREKAQRACAAVTGPHIAGTATPFGCEQTDYRSVAACADAVRATGAPLDMLICNAGINQQRLELVNGIEKNFVVNHLSHFILVNRLLGPLQAARQGRVVVVSSIAYRYAPPAGIEFDNLSGQRGYGPDEMYGQSKLANGLFARELARRLRGTATANVLHPGVVDTRMNRTSDTNMPLYWRIYRWFLGLTYQMKTVQQGAATLCYVATHPSLSGTNGAYFEDCAVVAAGGHMQDDAMAAKLWTVSENLTRPYLLADRNHGSELE